MNAFLKTSELTGSTFAELELSGDFVTQGTKIYFDLVQKAYGKVVASISAVIEANEASDSTVWNTTNDPQNDVEIDLNKLEVEKFNIARIEDFDSVLAVLGQPFFLTEIQINKLNEYLREFFEEEKLNEIKGMVA